MLAPGQTTNVLLTAHHSSSPAPAAAAAAAGATFAVAARPYLTSVFPFNNSTAIGFFNYKHKTMRTRVVTTPPRSLPRMEDTAFATQFADKLRSLASVDYPCNVPQKVDKRVMITISLNLQDCPANQTCKGYNGKRFYASMNNQSFVRPLNMSLLESHYHNLTTTSTGSFPEKPPRDFDYTGVDPLTKNMNTEFGTKLLAVPYGTKLEIVFQDTSFLNVENHPIHVHGHNLFIVGRGFGNFKDLGHYNYNLVDPPERNTVAVPMGGWAAIRFEADNPGVWFIHCHLEEHTSWGLATSLIVNNGPDPSRCLLPPPRDLPSC